MSGHSVIWAVRLLALRLRWAAVLPVLFFVTAAAASQHLVDQGLFGRSNAWDVLFNVFVPQSAVLVAIPVFILLASRSLTRPWEAQVWLRLQSRVRWWWAEVAALAILASGYTLLLAVAALAAAHMVGLPWSWGWSAFAHSNGSLVGAGGYQAQLLSPPPIVVAFEEVGVFALGLWVLSVLSQVVGLVARSQWSGLLASWGIVIIGYTLLSNGAAWLIRWLPGSQFTLAPHEWYAGFPVAWTVAYGALLLMAGVWVGTWVALRRQWNL